MGREMQTRSCRERRRPSGISIAEFGAACALGIPLIITILYVTLEASYYFSIRANIDLAARNAARALAIKAGSDASYKTDNNKCRTDVYDKIRIPGFVADSSQFVDPDWGPGSPQTVTVTCRYVPGAGSAPLGPLPRFPNPDPLNLGNTFRVQSTATFSIE